MGRLTENSVLNLKNKSHSVTAEVDVPDGGAERRDHRAGRRVRRLEPVRSTDGKPKYCYNLFGLREFHVGGTRPCRREHQVRMEFAYDGGGLGKGGAATLFVDGAKVGEGRVDATVPMVFSADETLDLGDDTGSPVSGDYTSAESRFTGNVNWVQLDIGEDDNDHFITDEERLKVAMARQ